MLSDPLSAKFSDVITGAGSTYNFVLVSDGNPHYREYRLEASGTIGSDTVDQIQTLRVARYPLKDGKVRCAVTRRVSYYNRTQGKAHDGTEVAISFIRNNADPVEGEETIVVNDIKLLTHLLVNTTDGGIANRVYGGEM